MTFTQMTYALAVTRYRNFSKAAESLFISQPALSLQIKKLEEELGAPLFIRKAQGIQLTTEGERFYREAQAVEQAWNHFMNSIQKNASLIKKHIRIGVGTRVYTNNLFDPLVHFFEEHPEIDFTFYTEASGGFISDLEKGSLDIALDRFPDGTDPQKFFACELISEQQCVLASTDNPLAQLESVTISQLNSQTILSGPENSPEDKITQQIFQSNGVAPNKIYRSDSINTIMMLARRGKGIVIGPASFASYFGVKAIPLVPETRMSLNLVCLQERADDRELRLLREHLLNLCQSH